MRVKLDKVCKRIYAGGDVPKDRYSTVKTAEYAIPIYANAEKDNGLYGYTDTARENELSITVAARGTIGFTAIRREPFLPVVRLITVVPDLSTVSERYLYYALRNCKPASSGTSIPQLTVPDIKKNEIELYSLSVQETIADKLDAVGRVIELRQQQLQTLDELVKARFVELFGDPMTDVSKWSASTIGEQFNVASGGTPATGEKAYWENGTIPWIGSNMCQDTMLSENDGKFITEEGYAHSSTKWFHKGTVLVALVGATIGKTALLRFDTTTNQNIAAIDVTPNAAFSSEFVFYHMQMLYSKFMEIGSGKFKMANQGFIRQLPLICPPMELQEQFAAFVEQTDKSKVAVQKALDEAQLLFDSLMQKYFG